MQPFGFIRRCERALGIASIAAFCACFALSAVASGHVPSGRTPGRIPPVAVDPVVAPEITPAGMLSPAEVSRALAGQGPGSLAGLWASSVALSRAQMERVQSFASREMPESFNGSRNVLYPFGGPDAIYPQMFFPQMTRLTLIGLEPVGRIPQARSAGELAGASRAVYEAHEIVSRLSYHRTLSMREQVPASLGVTPLLMGALAATGNEVLSARLETIDRGATAQPGEPNVVTVQYRKPDGAIAEVVYYNCDLSDAAFAANPEFAARMQNRGFDTAYYKAASYVSHQPGFRRLNELVAQQTQWVIESDTGLPARYVLEDPNWQRVRLFGIYSPPIATFGGQPQQMDLLEAAAGAACGSGGVAAGFQRLWGMDVCGRYGSSRRYAKVSYGGLVPFDVDYQRDKRIREAVFLMYASRR